MRTRNETDLQHSSQSDPMTVDVLCVYGPPYIESVKYNLVPALERQVGVKVRLHLINYDNNKPLFQIEKSSISITDWSTYRSNNRLGFGAAVNFLFKQVAPEYLFAVANPDTVPMPTAIGILADTAMRRGAGIVEARQWPFEHPKEYEEESLQTPWASGAFFVASSTAFNEVSGFDELLFMYNEDVDLSWRIRLSGRDVLYQPAALVHHYTGIGKYHPNVFYLEHFYSTRNFIVIAYKFWGNNGEKLALDYLSSSSFPEWFKTSVVEDYLRLKKSIIKRSTSPPDRWIKILGLNQYHVMRTI